MNFQHAPSYKYSKYPDEQIGAIDPYVIDMGQDISPLATNRVYISAFYVPSAIKLMGGTIAQVTPASDETGILRVGVHALGSPTIGKWVLGTCVVDLGVLPAHETGHRIFRANDPIEIQPGWYANVIGTTGEGVSVRYHKWATPGFAQYSLSGKGKTAEFLSRGPAVYMFARGQAEKITNGYDGNWEDTELVDARTSVPSVFQMMIPSWKR